MGTLRFCRWLMIACTAVLFGTNAYSAPTAGMAGDRIRVANEHLALEFDAANGAVLSVIDLRSGRNLTSAGPGTYRALWGVSLGHHTATNSPYADNNAAGKPAVSFETTADGAAARLTWHGILFHNAGLRVPGATVSVRVAVRANDPISRWTISIDGLGGLHATDLHFPIFGGVGLLGPNGADHALVVPEQGGRIITDPIGQRISWSQLYPSAHMSMQFAAYHNSDAGFYLGLHDPSGQTKQLMWWSPPEPSNSAVWTGHHYFPDQPADSMSLAHEIAVGVFQGDWVAAADLYRGWALQQSWAREAARKIVPDWYRASSYGSSYCAWNCGFPSTANFTSFVEHQAPNFMSLGGPSMLFLSGWEKLGAWAYGDALPPYEGWAAFDHMTSAVHASGNRLRVNIGFNKLDTATPLWKSGRADAGFVRDNQGQPVMQTIPIGADTVHNWTIMSSASAMWRNELRTTVSELAHHGVDAVMFDGWPINGVDDDYSSGHPKGRGGNWQWAAWKATLTELQADARTINPNLQFSTEEAHELLLPYIGHFDKRDSSAEINTYSQKGRPIPLMSYIYKPLMQIGPGDYWPWIRATDPDSYHQLVFARVLIWGEHLPFIYNSFKDVSLLAPRAFSLYKTIGEVRRTYGRFLIDGAMLPPPRLMSPTTLVELKGDGYAVPNYSATADAVQAGAWRARGGEVGLFFVNIASQPVTVNLPIDYAALRLTHGTSYRLTIATQDGTSQTSTINGTTSIPTTLAPQKVIILTLMPDTAAQECMFDWLETAYTDHLFPARTVSRVAAPYVYRYYSGANAYVGISNDNRHLYYLGPATGQVLTDLGSVSAWVSDSGCTQNFPSLPDT